MRIETIVYNRGTGFISRGPEPANEKFQQITSGLVEVFNRKIADIVSPVGGISEAEFIDYKADSDELLLAAKWGYFGLSQVEAEQANSLLQNLLADMMSRSDDLKFLFGVGGGK